MESKRYNEQTNEVLQKDRCLCLFQQLSKEIKKYCGNCNLFQIDTGMIFFGEFKIGTELRCLNGMKMSLNSSDSQKYKPPGLT